MEIDVFSKFVLTFPLRMATADTLVKQIEESELQVFGVPRLIICDNGLGYIAVY